MIYHKSALCFTKNLVYHERSKHIEVKVHYVRDKVSAGDVLLLKFDNATENPVDMGTKIISVRKFRLCLKLLGLC